MCGKMPDQYGVAPFLIGPYRFVFDIGGANTVYCSVGTVRRKRIAVSVLEDEAGISINDTFVEPNYLLRLPLCFMSSFDLLQHRNNADAGTRFWRHDMEACFFVVFIFPIDHVMIDTDNSFVEVTVFPAQANSFTDAAPCTEENRKKREPMIIDFVVFHIVNKRCLLCNSQGVSFRLFPVVALFDFGHCPGSGIYTNIIVSDS